MDGQVHFLLGIYIMTACVYCDRKQGMASHTLEPFLFSDLAGSTNLFVLVQQRVHERRSVDVFDPMYVLISLGPSNISWMKASILVEFHVVTLWGSFA